VADTKVRSPDANDDSARPRTCRQATARTVDTNQPPEYDSDDDYRPVPRAAVGMPRTLDDAEPVSMLMFICKALNIDSSRRNGRQRTPCLMIYVANLRCLCAPTSIHELLIYMHTCHFQQRSCPFLFGGLSRRNQLRMKALAMMHSRFWTTLFYLSTLTSCVFHAVKVEIGQSRQENAVKTRYHINHDVHTETLAFTFYHQLPL